MVFAASAFGVERVCRVRGDAADATRSSNPRFASARLRLLLGVVAQAALERAAPRRLPRGAVRADASGRSV